VAKKLIPSTVIFLSLASNVQLATRNALLVTRLSCNVQVQVVGASSESKPNHKALLIVAPFIVIVSVVLEQK
jgi:hypothetical protein